MSDDLQRAYQAYTWTNDPRHLTYEQWLQEHGGTPAPAASEPGPQVAAPPVLDFSLDTSEDASAPAPQGQVAPEGPVNAKAYFRSMGQDYQGGRGSDNSNYQYTSNSDFKSESELDAERRSRVDEEVKNYDPTDETTDKQPRPGRGPSAPASQPYEPPSFNYDFGTTPSFGGLGSGGGSKSAWGASYGGMGEDPYLKAMNSIADPFKNFFTQMQFNNF